MLINAAAGLVKPQLKCKLGASGAVPSQETPSSVLPASVANTVLQDDVDEGPMDTASLGKELIANAIQSQEILKWRQTMKTIAHQCLPRPLPHFLPLLLHLIPPLGCHHLQHPLPPLVLVLNVHDADVRLHRRLPSPFVIFSCSLEHPLRTPQRHPMCSHN